MAKVETYRAVIHDPKRAEPQADAHGTLTIPGALSTFGCEVKPLEKWATDILPTCGEGAYCEIFRVEEVLVGRIEK